jgi:hypothetical protein
MEKKEYKQGDLRVWWIPQIPMEPFRVDVESVAEGVKITHILAHYDMFQFENKVKPDYSNAGGIEIYDELFDGEMIWIDWYIEDPTFGYFDDPEEYITFLNKMAKDKPKDMCK